MWMPLLALLAIGGQEPAPEPADKDLGLKFDVLGWFASPSGSVTITRGSRPGTATPVEIDRDIDLGSEFAPMLEARWEFLESHAVAVRGSLLDLSGTHVTEQDFVYHGELFSAGRTVHAEMDFATVEFDYQCSFLKTGSLRLTGHLGAEYWAFSARLRTADDLPPLDTQRSFASAFWLVGLDSDWSPDPLVDLQMFVAGGTERANQYFFNLDARVVFRPWNTLNFSAGYRYQAVHFRQSTNRSDLNFQGPEVGLELRF
jgi:hypothetical protein